MSHDCIIPLIGISLFIAMCGMSLYLYHKRKGLLKRVFSQICSSEGFSDISDDEGKKQMLACEIGNIYNIGNTTEILIESPMLIGTLMKEEKNKTLYLTCISPWESKSSRHKLEHETIMLFITLPVHTGDGYIIRKKASAFVEGLMSIAGTKEKTLESDFMLTIAGKKAEILEGEPDFYRKFAVNVPSDLKGASTLTHEVQRYLLAQTEKYPFREGDKDLLPVIFISGRQVCIAASEILDERSLVELIRFGQTFSDCLIKSIPAKDIPQLTVESVKCSFCGVRNEGSDKFCINCGKEI